MVDLDATECHQLIMTCITQRLHSHSWFFNSITVDSFTFDPTITVYPYDLYDANGVDIDVVSVAAESQISDVFNGTSLLTSNTLALSLLGASIIQCGTNAVRSNTLVFSHIQISPIVDSCLLSSSGGVVSVSFQWSSSFTSQHAVERYRVSVSPDPSSCSSDQINSNQRYFCPGLIPDILYNFTLSAIVDCEGQHQEGQTNSFIVQLQAPQTSGEISLLPVYYHQNLSLIEVFVQWNEQVYQPHISTNCTFNSLTYTVSLEDSQTSVFLQRNVTSSKSCWNKLCNTTLSALNIPGSGNYRVNITISIDEALHSESLLSNYIAVSLLGMNATLLSFNCTTVISCNHESDGNCTIDYGQDPTYLDLRAPIQTPLNSPAKLPLLEPSKEYYYQTTFHVNSTDNFQMRGKFVTEPFSPRLSTSNLVLLLIGAIITCVDMIMWVLLLTIVLKAHKGWKNGNIVSLLVGAVFILILTGLWVAVGFHVGLQKNTCNPTWQLARDNMIISAHVFAQFSLLVLLLSLLNSLCINKTIRAESEQDIKMHQNEVYELKIEQEGGFQMEHNVVYGITKERDYEN